MADITVLVQSPGLSVWGNNTWGNSAWSDQGYTTVSTGTVSAYNNFGWGGDVWNSGSNWGDLADSTVSSTTLLASTALSSVNIEVEQEVSVSGLSISTAVGNEEAIPLNNGWGIKSWGFGAWGLTGDVLLQGQQITAVTGNAIASIDITVETGSVSASTQIGQSSSRIDNEVSLTGFSLQTFTGNTEITGDGLVVPSGATALYETGQATIDPTYLIGEGWGRDTYGNLGWGVNYSVIGGGANGIPINIVIGNEDAFTDVTIAVSGIELQSAITPVGTSANADHEIAHSFLIQSSIENVSITATALVEPSGISASIAQGDTIGGTKQEVPVTGIGLTTFIGNEDTAGNADVPVTGSSITGSVGQAKYIAGFDATGVSATFSVGSVTLIGHANVTPTGIELTANTTTPDIIAWAQVDTGTSVVWTPVDIAA